MLTAPVKFLLVDDLEANLLALKALLQRPGLEFLTATSGSQALELLLESEVALAILDVQMSEMDGYELAELMRGTERTRRIPIIFVTAGARDDRRRFRGYELGAVDFLYKPLEAQVVRSKVAVFFELAKQQAELKAALEDNQRLLAERARADALLRSVTESAPDLIYAKDRSGRIVFANSEAGRVFDKPLSTIVGCAEADCWPGFVANEEKIREADEKVFSHGAEQAIELSLLRDGDTRIYWSVRAPLLDENSKVSGLVTVCHDVTPLKRTEAALRLSEQRAKIQFSELDAIYQAAPLGLGVLDHDLRFLRVNRRLAEINGFPIEQHIGRAVAEVLPTLSEQAKAALRRVIDTGQAVHMEMRGQTPAQPGVERVWDEEFYPVRDDTGRIAGVGIVVDETTERRRMETAVRESEALFRAVAEELPHLAWIARPDGGIFWYNRRWYDFTGSAPGDAYNDGWKKYHHPDHLPRVIESVGRALNSSALWEETFPLRRADGSYRWFLTRAFPIRDTDGAITKWFGTNTDITDLRNAQEDLEQARRTLKEYADGLEKTVAERTSFLKEAIRQLEAFSYSIAHDMRAPLRSMSAYADILIQDFSVALPPEAQDYLRRIDASARRLDHLIVDVLAYSRVGTEDLPVTTVDLNQLLEHLLDSYPNLRAARKHVTVAPALHAVMGNVAALTQVLSNLLSNAVKFVPAGVTPDVRVWSELVEPGASDTTEQAVRLWVQDNGIGIDPAVQGRVFDMFQRFAAAGRYEGNGIGLAIARKATERMGGRIGVLPNPSGGSRFWVSLPAAEPVQN